MPKASRLGTSYSHHLISNFPFPSMTSQRRKRGVTYPHNKPIILLRRRRNILIPRIRRRSIIDTRHNRPSAVTLSVRQDPVFLSPGRDDGGVHLAPVLVEVLTRELGVALDEGDDLDGVGVGHVCDSSRTQSLISPARFLGWTASVYICTLYERGHVGSQAPEH